MDTADLFSAIMEEKKRFAISKATHIFEIYTKMLKKEKTVRYLELKDGVDFDVFKHFHVKNNDMVLDFPNTDSFFRFISYFPVMKYKMRQYYEKLPHVDDAGEAMYNKRREMILNKLNLAKAFIRLEPDLRYLTTLLRDAQKHEKVYHDEPN